MTIGGPKFCIKVFPGRDVAWGKPCHSVFSLLPRILNRWNLGKNTKNKIKTALKWKEKWCHQGEFSVWVGTGESSLGISSNWVFMRLASLWVSIGLLLDEHDGNGIWRSGMWASRLWKVYQIKGFSLQATDRKSWPRHFSKELPCIRVLRIHFCVYFKLWNHLDQLLVGEGTPGWERTSMTY